MKKIFTLFVGLMVAIAMFAADHRPTVTVNASRKFEIVIDGRHYSSNYGSMSISNLFNGRHNIKVYEQRPGFFFKAKRLVASSTFQLRNNDVNISVDRFGHLSIDESRFDRGWNDRRNGRDNDWDRRDRDHDNRF